MPTKQGWSLVLGLGCQCQIIWAGRGFVVLQLSASTASLYSLHPRLHRGKRLPEGLGAALREESWHWCHPLGSFGVSWGDTPSMGLCPVLPHSPFWWYQVGSGRGNRRVGHAEVAECEADRGFTGEQSVA